jgi:hypothetical protein
MTPLLFLMVFAAVAAEPDLKPEEGPANYGLCLDTARAYPAQGLERITARGWRCLACTSTPTPAGSWRSSA